MGLRPARAAAVALILLVTGASGQTDGGPITYGSYRTVHSKVLGEDRSLLIRLPADYAKSGKRYAVLYKLDGTKEVFLQRLPRPVISRT